MPSGLLDALTQVPDPRNPSGVRSHLEDRSSRPRTTPHRTLPAVEARVRDPRTSRKLGPARIGPVLGLPASTVSRITVRHGLHRPAWLDRPTGEPVRRYDRDRPGELGPVVDDVADRVDDVPAVPSLR